MFRLSARDSSKIQHQRPLYRASAPSVTPSISRTEGRSAEQEILGGHHTTLRYPRFATIEKRGGNIIRGFETGQPFPSRHSPFVFFSAPVAASHNSSHRRFPTRTFAPLWGYLIGSGVFLFEHASILGNLFSLHKSTQNSFYQCDRKLKR